jgi:hypothetical protein
VVDLALDPHELAHFAAGMLVGSRPMPDVVSKLALVHLSVCPSKLAPPVLDVIHVVTVKTISIVRFPLPSSLPLPPLELPLVHAAVLPFVDSVSFELSLNELAHVNISVD